MRKTSAKHKIKKERERFFLEHFISKCSPETAIIREGRDDGSDPDFVVSRNRETFGLEMSQIFKDSGRSGSRRHQQENYQYQLCQKVSGLYYKNAATPIHVFFFDPIPDDANQLEEIAKVLGEISSQMEELAYNRFSVAKGVSVYVRRIPNTPQFEGYRRWRIGASHMGWSKRLDAESLQAVVASKATRISRYPADLRNTILLLYCDRTNESGMLHHESDIPNIDSCGFSSVILYRYPDGEHHRLDRAP